jgi:hypothetical protein
MSVKLSQEAIAEILKRFDQTGGGSKEKDIPLVVWSQRTFSDDKLGNRTDLGPMFFFFWTGELEIEQDGYFVVDLTKDQQLALAPGSIFRADRAEIVLEDNRLFLKSNE